MSGVLTSPTRAHEAEWWTDHEQLADLVDWLYATAEILSARDAAQVIRKPWKWDDEHQAMCRARDEAAAA